MHDTVSLAAGDAKPPGASLVSVVADTIALHPNLLPVS
jgi:hypothetical protein